MAGTYPDIPGTRFAYDKDGSTFLVRNFETLGPWQNVVNPTNAQTPRNDMWATGLASFNSSNWVQYAMAFPEPRDLSGVFLHAGWSEEYSNLSSEVWEYSTDTTDGTDGTWSTFTVTWAAFGTHNGKYDVGVSAYREDIAPISLTNVRGIRFRYISNNGYDADTQIFTLHIYGSYTRTGLRLWDPSLDTPVGATHLDFGDMEQGTQEVRQVRVKNTHATLGATNVVVSIDDPSGYFGTNLQISADDVTYSPSINLGTLAAGAISSPFYVRRQVLAGETPAPHVARVLATSDPLA